MMSGILKYMVLPKEITKFEHDYLTKLNRITIYFFYLHIPVFMLVAWACDTGPVSALVFSLALLIGPTIAHNTLENPRTKSIVYGFTAMGMGALLVHFGQGPVQIEMHFYFFALLAMLCMYANPTVNIVAAVTVALHHLSFWYYLPNSVFNYDASVWVVGVHAAFVVLETVAACFISRRFFDDVIGLDKIIQQRTKALNQSHQDMRLILDNIGQGFITVTVSDGVMASEQSAIVTTWFGQSEKNTTFGNYIGKVDKEVEEWFQLGLESVQEDILPTEVALEQLPKRLSLGTKSLALSYKIINDEAGEINKLLIIITDITDQIEREYAETQQKQLMRIFGHIMRDKLGFLEFLTEADAMIDVVTEHTYQDLHHLKRIIHTIKGNAGLFGMTSVAELCHDLENEIAAEGAVPNDEKFTALAEAWEDMREELDKLLGHRKVHHIEINDGDYEAILQAVLRHDDSDQIASMIRSWKLEPTKRRLGFIKQQTEGLAQRMGKKDVNISVEPNNLRIESKQWAPFWSSFVHVLRNAVDHGIEPEDERSKSNKKGAGSVHIETYVEDGHFVVAVEDDGRGIDWQAVTSKAMEAEIPHESEADLHAALFTDGISTKDFVTQFSGRGIGMGVVKEECMKRGGDIEIITQEGEGTKFLFRFPLDESIYEMESSLDDLATGGASAA